MVSNASTPSNFTCSQFYYMPLGDLFRALSLYLNNIILFVTSNALKRSPREYICLLFSVRFMHQSPLYPSSFLVTIWVIFLGHCSTWLCECSWLSFYEIHGYLLLFTSKMKEKAQWNDRGKTGCHLLKIFWLIGSNTLEEAPWYIASFSCLLAGRKTASSETDLRRQFFAYFRIPPQKWSI